MALTKCKECGNEISTKAEACPKCGAKRPKATSGFTWIMGGLVGLMVYSCIAVSHKANEARDNMAAAEAVSAQANAARIAKLTPEQRAAEEKRQAEAAEKKAIEDAKTTVAYACRELVTKQLKDPDSAKWESPWYTDAKVSEKGKRFWIQIHGRSKNSFGAYTRSAFNCDLRRSGDKWLAVSIKEIN